MYDSYLVVKGTLKNDVVDGEVVGFSFGIRIANYRGNFLSLVHGFYVEVDGIQYKRDVQSFEINGKPPRSLDEIETCCWERWNVQDMGILHIAKPGGLESGTHSIRYMECILGAYGYVPFCAEFVENPPEPGDPRGAQKTWVMNEYELALEEGSR